MEKSKLRSYLEVATNVAVLLAATAVLASLAAIYFKPASRPQLRPGIQKGEALADLPGVNFGDSDRSLLIAMSTACVYCGESTPF